jgi:DNA-binding PadR family transcriptional regulator
VSVSGGLAFGTADQRRDQQVAAGVKYFTKVREHQRQIKQAIEELEQANAKDKKGESF